MMLMLLCRGPRLSQALFGRFGRNATIFERVSLLRASLLFLKDLNIDEDLT
jgi:hypothetical protein